MNKEQRVRVRVYQENLEMLADKLGCTAAEAEDFMDTLMYSAIPTIDDAHLVVDWFISHGWSPQTDWVKYAQDLTSEDPARLAQYLPPEMRGKYQS